MTEHRFIQPIDVLYLRGNRTFGEPGSYGQSLLPPWPSVAAGALRSLHYAQTGEVLDSADDFRLTAFQLARCEKNEVESIHAVPADLLVTGAKKAPRVQRLQPGVLADGLLSSASLAQVPILAQSERSKPLAGYWLTQTGWQCYLDGGVPEPADLLHSEDLWVSDFRVGVGLDTTRRSAADGKLFSMQAIAFAPGIGFLTASQGQRPVPARGILRFGGDGRGAELSECATYVPPQADHAAIAAAGRARIVLTTPGIFPEGWRLPGMQADGRFELGGVRARVVAAAVPRAEVVSGWDLAQWQPKPAQRVAPTGSVYWLDELHADPAALGKLAEHGLWADSMQDGARRVEGFNRFAFAAI